MGITVDMSIDGQKQPFFDKDTYPGEALRWQPTACASCPECSSIRDGCYIGHDVVCMPPMFVNAGAYVGDGTMIDSHALVGSCSADSGWQALATFPRARRSAACSNRLPRAAAR